MVFHEVVLGANYFHRLDQRQIEALNVFYLCKKEIKRTSTEVL
jgi:hypothetical protein